MIDELREDIIEGIEDDWIYYAEILSMIQEINGDSPDILQQSLDAAVHFIDEGLIVPGDIVSAPGFTPWPGTHNDWITRLRHEVGDMIAQGTEPRMGEICWFDFPNPNRQATPNHA